jgi:hypothetical protein
MTEASDTQTPDKSPLEPPVLSMSHDLKETIRLARQLQEQGRMLEIVARSLAADMAEARKACGLRTSSKP